MRPLSLTWPHGLRSPPQTPGNVLFLMELLWKPQPPMLVGVTSVMIVLVYALDGWFFGFFNSQLRARYALLFGCRSGPRDVGQERLDEHSGARPGFRRRSDAATGARPGRVSSQPQTGGPARDPRESPDRSFTDGGRGVIWVVPRLPRHFADVAKVALSAGSPLGGETPRASHTSEPLPAVVVGTSPFADVARMPEPIHIQRLVDRLRQHQSV